MPPIANDMTDEERQLFADQGTPLPDESSVDPAPPPAEPAEAAEPAPADPNAPPVDPNAPPADPNAPPADPNAPVDPNAPKPPPGFVPHGAFHAERSRAAALARTNALLMARTNALLARQQEQQPPPMPDLEADPVAYIRSLEERLANFENQRQEEQQHRQVDFALEQDEATFASYTPDYPQASDYYVQSRARELLQFHTPEQAQRIMVAEARQIAQKSWELGKPAAQTIYELAQSRGYQPGATSTPTPTPTPAVPGQPAPAAAPARPSPAAVIESVRRGQEQSRSLSPGTGGAGAAPLNAEAILAMSDEEFEQFLKPGTKGADERFASIAGR